MTKFDITVFGASSTTGKSIVEHLFQLSIDHPHLFPKGFQWAIAGKDSIELDRLIQDRRWSKPTVPKPACLVLSDINKSQLDNVTQQTKVLINTLKSNHQPSETIIKSCIENECHYIDLSNEVDFATRIYDRYNDKACKNKTSIIHCCGFNGVPVDMGVAYVKNLCKQNGWTPYKIESFLKIHTGDSGLSIEYENYKSAVQSVKDKPCGQGYEYLKSMLIQTIQTKLGQSNPGASLGYRVPHSLFQDEISVVQMSQSSNKTEFKSYLTLPALWIAVLWMVYQTLFEWLARRSWGEWLLLQYSEQLTFGHVSKTTPDQISQTSFEYILFGHGQEEMKVVVRGPHPTYQATPRIALQCALTVLLDPVPHGVLTPAAAFDRTNLIERLAYVGIQFLISK